MGCHRRCLGGISFNIHVFSGVLRRRAYPKVLPSTLIKRYYSETVLEDDKSFAAGPRVLSKDGSIYYDFIETTWIQRALLSVGSAFVSIRNPAREDMVAALGEITISRSLAQRILHKMAADSVGRKILSERPIINGRTVDIDKLQSLPDNTFGKHYANFMTSLGITADTRTPVHFIEDEDLAYVMYRYRTIHDFVHVLLGMNSIGVAAEVAVKWFEMVQTGIPMTVFSSTFGLYANGITSSERQILVKKLIPWALLCGQSAKFMLNTYYEKELERNIADLRAELGIIPTPVVL